MDQPGTRFAILRVHNVQLIGIQYFPRDCFVADEGRSQVCAISSDVRPISESSDARLAVLRFSG